jgi:hypothetical protein
VSRGSALADAGPVRTDSFNASSRDWLDRGVLIAFSLLLFVISAAHRHLAAGTPGTGGSPLLEANAGEVLAAAALVKVLISQRDRPLALAPFDLALLALASLAWLAPHQNLPFLAFTIAGLWALARRRSNPILLPAAQIWLAVSAYELWGRSLFKLTSSVIIEGETRVLASVGRVFYPGLQQDGIRLVASPDWFIYILEGCSAFHNLSLAVLVWVCLVRLADGRFGNAEAAALASGLAGVFTLNVTRILLMAPSRDAYVYWHEGQGAFLFSVLTLAVVAVPTLIAVRRSA